MMTVGLIVKLNKFSIFVFFLIVTPCLAHANLTLIIESSHRNNLETWGATFKSNNVTVVSNSNFIYKPNNKIGKRTGSVLASKKLKIIRNELEYIDSKLKGTYDITEKVKVSNKRLKKTSINPHQYKVRLNKRTVREDNIYFKRLIKLMSDLQKVERLVCKDCVVVSFHKKKVKSTLLLNNKKRQTQVTCQNRSSSEFFCLHNRLGVLYK